jgi:hypothetical protein
MVHLMHHYFADASADCKCRYGISCSLKKEDERVYKFPNLFPGSVTVRR